MKIDESPPFDLNFEGKRILLVDDLQLNLYLIEQLLTERGAVVVTASDGQEALNRCNEQRFDLIILDIRMPNLDGKEACRAIRKMSSTNALVPIVGLTAHMFDEEQVSYLSLGMNAAVTKPVEPDTFLPLLHRLLTSDLPASIVTDTLVVNSDLCIDLTYLKKVGNDNLSFIAMMIASFLRNADELQRRLSVALDTTDIQGIGEIAHQLKFSLGVLGIGALDEKLNWLQHQAQLSGVEDTDWFMMRSRRLQENLNIIIAQAMELQGQIGQPLSGNT